jgi:threonine dehydratase
VLSLLAVQLFAGFCRNGFFEEFAMLSREAAALAVAAHQADTTIRPIALETPLVHAPVFSRRHGAEVWFKLENEQVTGSFKLRGAANKLLALSPAERARGVVAASSGNHGAAVSYAAAQLGVPVRIYVPDQVAPVKAAKMRRYGAELVLTGDDSLVAELAARAWAVAHGLPYISPYHDRAVVAGQGSCGVELLRQRPALETVLIAVGGGGLIGGMAAVLKAANPAVRIIGCQPENSPVMARSVAAGQLLDLMSLPTLSDGTAGGIEAGAFTFGLCRELVDEWVLVSEAEIAAALDEVAAQGMIVEGAAGVAVAALGKAASVAGRQVAVVICGGNRG